MNYVNSVTPSAIGTKLGPAPPHSRARFSQIPGFQIIITSELSYFFLPHHSPLGTEIQIGEGDRT